MLFTFLIFTSTTGSAFDTGPKLISKSKPIHAVQPNSLRPMNRQKEMYYTLPPFKCLMIL